MATLATTLNPTLVAIFVIGAAVGGVSGVLSSVLLSEKSAATERRDRSPRTQNRSPLGSSVLRAVGSPVGDLPERATEQRPAVAGAEQAAGAHGESAIEAHRESAVEAHGESAAVVLARLEAAYLAQLTKTPPEHASPETEAVAPESPELALASLSPVEPDLRPAHEHRGEDGEPPGSVTIKPVEVTTNNMVVNAPTLVTTHVFMTGSPPSHELPDGAFVSVAGPTVRAGSGTMAADSSASTDARDRGDVTSGSLVPASTSTSPVVPPLRTAPSARPRPGTPTSSHGRNPWAPIDMSRHHNPWGAGRLP